MSSWPSLRRLSASLRPSKRSQQATADENRAPVPPTQSVLLLHAPKEQYNITHDYPVPDLLQDNEVLIKTRAIGLNPIDWKAPDFNFGIPELPYISGRELSGDIARVKSSKLRWRVGDKVIAISTDYRDLRKGAYQQYVVSLDHTLVRLPQAVSYEDGATLGVAFVAAALALGVCMGVNFSSVLGGPNLFGLLKSIDASVIPEDVRREALHSIHELERPKQGDWLAIWGGSATSANLTIQLAKLVGLRVVVVVDKAKHGFRISSHKSIRPDLLVDSHDPVRAIEIIKANTKGQLRFGLDTRGRESASNLLRALSPGNTPLLADEHQLPPSPPGTPDDRKIARAHLIGMTGLPKGPEPEGSAFHAVPIKLFHDVPEVGASLSAWLGRLLDKGLVHPPDIIDVEQGLESINSGLDRMRRGEISGGKLVVRV